MMKAIFNKVQDFLWSIFFPTVIGVILFAIATSSTH